ncbi:MAG TPA: FAD-linked oxidase C-terminal domain-containing protein [Candidatus Acidoferrales bacterium]|nr:FAD-linked oxidase C-terminal domain-containing protein [Candidatus Acidoferrales bacterium]
MITNSIRKRLKEIFGKENVLDSAEDRIAYSYDGTPLLSSLPEAVVVPSSVEQISKLMLLANEEKFSVVPRGSGTGLSGGSIPTENSVVLLMTRWNKVIELDKNNLTAWVEPGVITGKFQSLAESEGLFYPPDPGSSQICTLGGNVAENAGGLRGLKYGVTKNYVLGLEVVLPTGEVMHIGGKNTKDVAGYNLKDILIGSEGTLGIFTKILFKLIPMPQSNRTVLAFYDSMTKAAETVSEITAKRIMPAMLEFLDNPTIRAVEDFAHLGLDVNTGALLLIEVDGAISAVEEDTGMIRTICKNSGASDIKIAKDEAESTKLKAARKTAFAALARIRPTTILEDVTVPRSELPAMVDFISETAEKYDVQIGTFGHAGDGNLHPTGLTDERDRDEIQRTEQTFDEIFRKAVDLGGTITGEHGVGLAKKKFFEELYDTSFIRWMKQTKEMFDPNCVLNPGKIISVKPRCEGALPKSKEQIEKIVSKMDNPSEAYF